MSDVVVVGAGLAGLAAAYEARCRGADVVVLESEPRPGGVVITEKADGGWLVEGGPDSFLPGDGSVATLAAQLDVAQRIVPQSTHGSARWTGQELTALSEGEAAALLGIQAKPEDLNAGHMSFAGGMGEIVSALAAALGSSLRIRTGVSGISPSGDGFRLSVTGGSTVSASSLILALPSWRAAQLLRGLEPHTADVLGAIRYLPSLTVSLAYRSDQFGTALEGTGFVVASDAGRASGDHLRACTYASRKFPGRAPAGYELIRAFLSEPPGPPEQAAHQSLVPILKLMGEPLWSRTYAWLRGIPFYARDHATRLAEARRRLAGIGNLWLAGAGYDGAGVGACVKSGQDAGRGFGEASRGSVKQNRQATT